MKIIVIGSGFGGLAAANRLAAKGHEVLMVEKRDKIGGRAYQYEKNGFKFDGGPTVMTAPYIFDEIFKAAGRNRQDYINFMPLDPFYRIFDGNGRHFDYHRYLDDMLEEVAKINPADQEGYRQFAHKTEEVFKNFYHFINQSSSKVSEMMKIMPKVLKLGTYRNTYQFVAKHIKDPFLRQVFSFHPLLIGGNPFDTPSFYTLIAQCEREWGVHYAQGGTGAVVGGLGRLFLEQGGDIWLNTEVEEILISGRRVTGVRLSDGTTETADAIVSNGDLAFTYRHLIPAKYRRKYTNRRLASLNYSNSLFVIYFGTKRRYLDSRLQHHNLILNGPYQAMMKDLFSRHKLPEKMGLYLHMPTITDPSIAPEGCESFYVLSLVPNLKKGNINWSEIGEMYRDHVLQFLEDNYLPDLRENIVAQHHIDPLHFRHTLNSYRGAAFAMKPTLFQSAMFRPQNKSEEFDNLYFAGAGTHPGAGVPAVLSSGKIAAELIDPTPETETVPQPTYAYA